MAFVEPEISAISIGNATTVGSGILDLLNKAH